MGEGETYQAAGASLPTDLTSFVGRRAELLEVRRLLGQSRLVTICGSAGVGKTRLATRTAFNLRRAFDDAVWFIDLSGVSDPALVPSAVSASLGITSPRGASAAAVAAYLGDRRCLLVVDNCEHVVEAVAAFITELVTLCPAAVVLATSRERLMVEAEAVFPLMALDIPSGDLLTPVSISALDSLRDVESVRLFLDRMMAVAPHAHLEAADLAAIGEVCRRLEGIPLAIELAAARSVVLSPGQLVERLADPYALLTGGQRGRPDRHQTLRASIEWSYQLCTAEEQDLWARLAVFAGGFELDAAEFVGSANGAAPVLDLLQTLVAKSVVIRHQSEGRSWYSMLETIREFGRESLQRRGEVAATTRRLRDFYLQLLLECERDWIGPRQRQWLARLQFEQHNLRTALEFCLCEPGEEDAALGLIVPAWRFVWAAWGRQAELHGWLNRVLDATSTPTPLRAQAMVLRGHLTSAMGEVDRGVAQMREAREQAMMVGDLVAVAAVDSALAEVAGDDVATIAAYKRSLEVLGRVPELIGRAGSQGSLARAYTRVGDHDNATRIIEQMLHVGRESGERYECSLNLLALGMMALERGDVEQAEEFAAHALRLKRELGDLVGVAWALETLGAVAAARGDFSRGVELFGAARVVWRHSGGVPGVEYPSYPPIPGPRSVWEPLARAALGESRFDEAIAAGASLSLADAVAGDAAVTPPSGSSHRARHGSAGQRPLLTPRERQVVALVAEGLSNRQIATRLVVTTRTAEGHLQRVLVKVGLNSRAQLTAWARRNPEQLTSE